MPAQIGKSNFFLVDTPGFDDTRRGSSVILREITRILTTQYKKTELSLKGVIFLHRISENRMRGSSIQTLEIFQKICGVQPLKNVILATTRWDEVEHSVGTRREDELRNDFWEFMLSKGSNMTRFNGTRASAVAMVSQLLAKESTIFDIQRQLVDEGLALNETQAGIVVEKDVCKRRDDIETEIEGLDALRRTLTRTAKDALTMKKVDHKWTLEKGLLQKTKEDQMMLQKYPAIEVRDAIESKFSKKRKFKSMPALLRALSMFGAFVAFADNISAWLSNLGFGDWVNDFLETVEN